MEKSTKQSKNFPKFDFGAYKIVNNIWKLNIKNENEIVAKHDHIPENLSYRNLRTLYFGRWLNDEVIAYLLLYFNPKLV